MRGVVCLRSLQALARSMAAGGLSSLTSVLRSTNDRLLVTFGSASIAPFVANWVKNVQSLGIATLLVGALDNATHAACLAGQVPVVRVSEASGSISAGIPTDSGGETLDALSSSERMLRPIIADRDAWDCRKVAYHLPAESLSMGESDAMRHVALQFVDACIEIGDGRKRQGKV